MGSVLNIGLIFLLVLVNGFFVAAEFALVGVRRSRIALLAEENNPRAKRVLRMLDNLNGYISATQLGITIASLGLGWIGEPAVARLLEVPLHGRLSETAIETIAFTIAFSVITFLHIVLGELAPKTLALERAERTALAVAWPLEMFHHVFRWPVRLLDWAGTRTVRLFGLHPSTEHAAVYSQDELRRVIDVSWQGGQMEEDQQKLVHRIFDFSDEKVREAMVPRTAMHAIPSAATLAEVKEAFRTLGYSRLPVYGDVIDNVLGILLRKDIEPYLEQKPSEAFDLVALIRPPLFVPDTAPLSVALKQMQAARTHLLFVVDEHGAMQGMVTLEDVLEEIVGEISDEYDEEMPLQIVEHRGSYLLDGMVGIRDMNRRFNLHLPEDAAYTTLAGFLMAKAGQVLSPGDVVDHEGARFVVERVQRRRLRRVRLTLPEEAQSDDVQLLA